MGTARELVPYVGEWSIPSRFCPPISAAQDARLYGRQEAWYLLAFEQLIGRDAALRRPRPRAAGGTRGSRDRSHPFEAPLNAARTAQRASLPR